MADSGEDGRVRSPIKGLFKNVPIVTIAAALGPMLPKDKLEEVLSTCWAMAEQVKELYPDLTTDMVQAIVAYTMELQPKELSVYWLCNKALRDMNREAVQPWVAYIHLLLTALSRLPGTAESVVFRGYKIAYTELGPNFKQGGLVVFSGFTSAATSLQVMQAFVGKTGPRTLLTIRLTSSPRSISAFSLYPQEAEVVLPPGSTFKIESIFDTGGGLVMLELQQQPSHDEIMKF